MTDLHPFLKDRELNFDEGTVGILSDVDGTILGGTSDQKLQGFLKDIFNFNAAAVPVLTKDLARVLIYSGDEDNKMLDIPLFDLLREDESQRNCNDLASWITNKSGFNAEYMSDNNIQVIFDDDDMILQIAPSVCRKQNNAGYGVHPADDDFVEFLQDWAQMSAEEKAQQLCVWFDISDRFGADKVQNVMEAAVPALGA